MALHLAIASTKDRGSRGNSSSSGVMPRVLQACEDGQMGEPEACRICGISPEILWDHPELAVRCVRVQFTGPSRPGLGAAGSLVL